MIFQTQNDILSKELIPKLPTMIGKSAMHSYRIRCCLNENGLYNRNINQTYFIKNCEGELIALFIVDCDNTDIILVPPDTNQSYFLCHNRRDYDIMSYHKMKFCVDVLVHGAKVNCGDCETEKITKSSLLRSILKLSVYDSTCR